MKTCETQDFYFVVFAMNEGIKPLEIQETGQRKLFIFENSPRFQDVKRTYYWDEAVVNPRHYKREIHRLKAIISN